MSLRLFALYILLVLSSCEALDIFGPENPGPKLDQPEWYDADADPEDVVMVLSTGPRVTSNRGIGNSIIWIPDETVVDSMIIGAYIGEFDNSRTPNFFTAVLVGGASNVVEWVNLYDGQYNAHRFDSIGEKPINYGWSNQVELWGREICVQRVSGMPGEYIGIGLRFKD